MDTFPKGVLCQAFKTLFDDGQASFSEPSETGGGRRASSLLAGATCLFGMPPSGCCRPDFQRWQRLLGIRSGIWSAIWSGIRAVGCWKSWSKWLGQWDSNQTHTCCYACLLSTSSFHQTSVSCFVGCVELLNVFNEAASLFFFPRPQCHL